MQIRRLVVGPLATNCYLLKSDQELAIIDPGGDPDIILASIKAIGGDLKFIIITHYHNDHIGALADLKDSHIQVMIHEKDQKFIDFPIDRLLRDNDKIVLGTDELTVISTPGHSAGSICLSGKDFIFTGDTLFSDGCGRTDLKGGSDFEMEQSLKLLTSLIQSGMAVYPGHGNIYVA